MPTPLTDEQRRRYDRNIRIRGFGEAGQERLLDAAVLVIGAGGLGSSAILYLAAAGVGTLGIADDDVVDEANLQRQVIHTRADVGRLKVESASEKVARLDPGLRVLTHAERVVPASIAQLIAGYDFIIDCTDNFETKLLVNDACVLSGTPLCHCGVLGLSGRIMTYAPGHACVRCVFEEPIPSSAPTADDLGILGATAGALGAMQAAEAVKYLTGVGRPITDALLHVDLGDGSSTRIEVRRDRRCQVCGTHPAITHLV